MLTLTSLCSCACGALLVTKQDRANGLCPSCADKPCCVAICANGEEFIDSFGEDLPRASSALPTEATEELPEPTEAEIDAYFLCLEEQQNFFGNYHLDN